MSNIEVPKLNRDSFPTWKILMKLYLGGHGVHVESAIPVEYDDPTRALTVEDLKKKKGHN